MVKIAVHAARLQDTLPLLDLPADRPQVLLAMGEAGIVTRVLPDRFGSAWTYAGEAWAPGQIPAARLRGEFRFGALASGARLFGLVANPIGHSVSPAMHNAAFAAAGLQAVYVPFQAADASDFLAFAERLGVEGASVTTPFKTALIPACRPDDVAAEVGAVNTLLRTAEGWSGFNTDVAGFLAPLTERLAPGGIRAALLGAGGAARAAAVALRQAGAHVTVYARRPEAADAIARAVHGRSAAMPPAPGSWDLLVNASSAGMHPRADDTPWPGGRFDGRLVYDLVYNPQDTRLLQEARAAGCETLGGLEMLVGQAGRQVEIWTGRTPDLDVMRRAALARLAAFHLSPTPVARS